jgi:hypothetical protein
VYAFFDDSILSQFDDIITVNDPVEKIVSTISGDNTTVRRKQEGSQPDAGLTDREIEVLKLLAAGMATKEIAAHKHKHGNKSQEEPLGQNGDQVSFGPDNLCRS